MLNKEVYVNRRKKLKENFRDGLILIMGNNFSPLDCEDNTYPFIKQCKNTRDFSHEMNCTKILVSIQGNLYVDAE